MCANVVLFCAQMIYVRKRKFQKCAQSCFHRLYNTWHVYIAINLFNLCQLYLLTFWYLPWFNINSSSPILLKNPPVLFMKIFTILDPCDIIFCRFIHVSSTLKNNNFDFSSIVQVSNYLFWNFDININCSNTGFTVILITGRFH